MNGISMQNNVIQIPKVSSAALVVDFVVTTSKIDRKFEAKNLELMKKKAELEAKRQQQDNKQNLPEVSVKRNSKTKEVKHNVQANKTHAVEKPVVEVKANPKSKIGTKIDSKI